MEVVKFSALAQPGDNLANNQAFQRWGNRLGTGEDSRKEGVNL